jgi:hypothetical protein
MTKKKAQHALSIAKELAKKANSSIDFHNAFFGVGGKFGELFPSRSEREAFLKTAEYQEVFQMREDLVELEIAWDELSAQLNGTRSGHEPSFVGYKFLTPDQVLAKFFSVSQKHEKWRTRLLDILTATNHVENGKIRVPKACPLAAAM